MDEDEDEDEDDDGFGNYGLDTENEGLSLDDGSEWFNSQGGDRALVAGYGLDSVDLQAMLPPFDSPTDLMEYDRLLDEFTNDDTYHAESPAVLPTGHVIDHEHGQNEYTTDQLASTINGSFETSANFPFLSPDLEQPVELEAASSGSSTSITHPDTEDPSPTLESGTSPSTLNVVLGAQADKESVITPGVDVTDANDPEDSLVTPVEGRKRKRISDSDLDNFEEFRLPDFGEITNTAAEQSMESSEGGHQDIPGVGSLYTICNIVCQLTRF